LTTGQENTLGCRPYRLEYTASSNLLTPLIAAVVFFRDVSAIRLILLMSLRV